MNTIWEVLAVLILSCAEVKLSIKPLSIVNNRDVHIWNYISQKFNTDIYNDCFTKLIKHYLQSNPAPLT